MPIQTKIDCSEAPWEARISSAAVREATGKDWSEWFELLDSKGALSMTHQETAAYLESSSELTNPGWWAQMITVACEQKIGRRVTGQNCYGEFTAN